MSPLEHAQGHDTPAPMTSWPGLDEPPQDTERCDDAWRRWFFGEDGLADEAMVEAYRDRLIDELPFGADPARAEELARARFRRAVR